MSIIIIARTEDNCHDTVRVFSEVGYEVIPSPISEIIYRQMDPNLDINFRDRALFTSRFAVIGYQKITNQKPEYCFCIGKKTAYQAWKAGFSNIEMPDTANSDGLIALLEKNHLKGMLNYFVGVNRKNIIEDYLNKKKYSFKIIEVYDAIAKKEFSLEVMDALKSDKDLSIICYSVRCANIFYKLSINNMIAKQRLISLRWHVIGSIDSLDFKVPYISCYNCPNALEEALLL